MIKLLRVAVVALFFVLLAVLLIHSLNSINQDIGRHLKSGQIIWETKQVYKVNLFSFTEPNNPFVNHHWLSEVAFFLLNSAIGLRGLIIFKAAILLLSFLVLFLAVQKNSGMISFLISGLVAVLVFIERTDVRPEIFSYFFLSLFLCAIFRAKYARVSDVAMTSDVVNKRWLYFLPLVQILWTNMHIYFVLGPILLFFFAIDRFFEKRDEFKRVSYVFLATAAATLVNPNFIKGALVPFNILRRYGYSIVENQNIFFLRDYGISLQSINLFQISLVILLFSFIVAFRSGRRKVTFELLTAAFMSVMAVKMLRNFGVYALTFIPIVSLNLSTLSSLSTSTEFLDRLKHGQETTPRQVGYPQHRLAKSIYLVFCGLLVFLILNTINDNVYSRLESSKRFGLSLPSGAEKGVEFVKQSTIKGPVFNNFDVGSFLIWKMYPKEKVFVDGRPEAYSVEFFEKIYKPMQENPALWKKYSEKYEINYVFFAHTDITPWARKFLSDISKNSDWPLIYADDSVVIFIKRVPWNERVVNKFEIRAPSVP